MTFEEALQVALVQIEEGIGVYKESGYPTAELHEAYDEIEEYINMVYVQKGGQGEA